MAKNPKVTDPHLVQARETDIVIPIMGATGAGKSSFINTYLASAGLNERVDVGDSLVSCTVHIRSIVVDGQITHRFPHLPPETRVVIVDTPGFDDTIASDFEILKRIANWLQESYRKNMVLGGVIYLHDISQDRFSGTARRNLEMFNHLCGDAALSKVVLVTSKWGRAYGRDFDRREEELKQIHWKNMLKPGKNGESAKVLRLEPNNDQGSARKVVETILKRVDRAAGKELIEEGLQIQKELVVSRKFLPDTQAGVELKHQLQAMIDAQTQMLALEAEAAKGDPEAEKQLREAEEKVRLLAEQVRKLKVPFLKRLGRWMGFRRG